MNEVAVPLQKLSRAKSKLNLFDFDLAAMEKLVTDKWQEPKYQKQRVQ